MNQIKFYACNIYQKAREAQLDYCVELDVQWHTVEVFFEDAGNEKIDDLFDRIKPPYSGEFFLYL